MLMIFGYICKQVISPSWHNFKQMSNISKFYWLLVFVDKTWIKKFVVFGQYNPSGQHHFSLQSSHEKSWSQFLKKTGFWLLHELSL